MGVGGIPFPSFVALDAAALHADLVGELVLREARLLAVAGDVLPRRPRIPGRLGADELVVLPSVGRLVREGIASLPEKHRSVVVLYYLQRLSLQETAEVLGIQLGTVKSPLHYALRNLRTHLEGDRRFGGAYGVPADDVEIAS